MACGVVCEGCSLDFVFHVCLGPCWSGFDVKNTVLNFCPVFPCISSATVCVCLVDFFYFFF